MLKCNLDLEDQQFEEVVNMQIFAAHQHGVATKV